MLRRGLVQLMAFLLVALPALGVPANDSHAESSRIAVIKEMSGDVKVQKAGGSKAFRAFAKLSLKQGDILTTGKDGEATLVFSNGSSSDDSMTVSGNTTLTFSKLSGKSGSVTKVSMLKGTVWSDVKSIKTKDDEFQLETPTAVMGVRGTDFFTTVSPLTGGTNLFVFAGVVHTDSSLAAGSLPSSGTPSQGYLVYPTQQIYLPGQSSPESPIVTFIDPADIVGQASPEVIKAILMSKEKIDEENRSLIDQMNQDQSITGIVGIDPDLYIQNLNSMIGAMLQGAVAGGDMTRAQLDLLLNQIFQQTGKKVDVSDTNYRLTDDQKLSLEELQKRKLADQQASLEKKKQQEGAPFSLIEQLRREREQQEAANQALLEKLRLQAESRLLDQLSDAQKAAYEAAKKLNEGTSGPVISQPTTPSLSANSLLGSLELTGAVLSPAFDASKTAYMTSVANNVTQLALKLSVQDNKASVTVNGTAPTGGSVSVPLNVGSNTISIVVTAENGSKMTYTITATRAEAPPSGNTGLTSLQLVEVGGRATYDATSDGSDWSVRVPASWQYASLKFVPADASSKLVLNGREYAASDLVPLSLATETVSFQIKASDGTSAGYELHIAREASSIATVTSGAYTVSETGSVSETISNVPYGTAKIDFLAALMKGDPNQTWDETGLSDPIANGDILKVTAEDGGTIKQYAISLKVEVPLGINHWTTTLDGTETSWSYDGEESGTNGEIPSKTHYYSLYLTAIPTSLQVGFDFADNAAGAMLYKEYDENPIANFSQSPDPVSLEVYEGNNTFSLNYQVEDDQGEATEIKLILNVYVGVPAFDGFNVLSENDWEHNYQSPSLTVNPTGPHSFSAFTGSYLNPDNNRLVMRGGMMESGMEVLVNGAEASSDGVYYMELNEAWNTITVRLYNGPDWTEANRHGTAAEYTLDVYNGDQFPEDTMGLESLNGTDSYGEPREFGKDGPEWFGWLPSGAEFVDLAPIARSGGSVEGALIPIPGTDDWQWAKKTGDRYRIPLNTNEVYIVTEQDGHLWSESVSISWGSL
ncbi:cadherin-like beta sandwich domain-containing protein [Cohnella zeiphila]|uniref:Cadherin-like beta sandwich domain-containing protein n=1 Tax=Cohnella zeiphila TaxID=2761120 RepID=A0A7X0SNB3_9BACL|nr:cadherin-like beta sandwich domain-containing protein [Cohnella zeiphila]MBB6732986.1 cadherin-like beta sandwich domain-containing protein [Cohnella zeiphila]